MQNPSLRATQLFLLYHTAGNNPVAIGQIGSGFAQAFPRALVVSIGGTQPSGDEPGRQWFSPDNTDLLLQLDGVMAEFTASLRYWQQLSGIKVDATALVGCSQSSIMVLEAVKSQADLVGRVVAFSGRYATLPERASRRTTIHLIHGGDDSTLPFTHAVEAEERLTALGGM